LATAKGYALWRLDHGLSEFRPQASIFSAKPIRFI